jgi:hypothetical protein
MNAVPRLGLAAAAILLGCVGEAIDMAPEPRRLEAPPRDSFETVADALQVSCGTLDCHGQAGRNLRLYGARGLRLDPRATSAEGTTTPAEYEATFWSLVGLEPETLSAVVREQGTDPLRLTFMRKARGAEQHKGGALMKRGDDLDVCLTSWLGGAVMTPACEAIALAPRPELPGSPAR